MAYDMFGTREMTAAVMEMKPVGNFFSTTFFKAQETHDTEAIDIDIWKGKRKVAPYTRASAKSTPLARTNFATGSFKIPYIKISRGMDPAMAILRRSMGSNIYAGETPQERAAKQVARDLQEMDEAVQRAEELQAAQAIIDAKVIIKGEEVDAEIDLQRDSTLSFAASSLTMSADGAVWSNVNAEIPAMLADWALAVFRVSGYTPNQLVGSRSAIKALLKNVPVQSLLDNRRIVIGGLNFEPLTSPFPGARFYGNIAGFDIWEYSELYLDDADNTEKFLLPDGYIVLASSGMRCTRHYGVIQDMDSLEPLRRFVKSVKTDDPSTITAILQSAPAFINHNPDGTAKINVLA